MRTLALALATALALHGGPLDAQAPPPPTRVLLFIGDGVGLSYWSAAAFAADRLAVHRFPVIGLVDTRSSDSRVTDSAASATAYAAGVKTYNAAIGMAPDTTPVRTILELAIERGLATGLVSTSRITHATPAAFAAHVPDRQMEWEIARQMAEHNVSVILGGGRAMFDRRYRPDSLDLLTPLKARYTYVTSAAELAALDRDTVRALLGLFADSHMPAAARAAVTQAANHADPHGAPAARDTVWQPWRTPTLPEMTRAALDVVGHNPRGFFLMVEAAQPDWRGHGNEPLGAVTAEMLDFDAAIQTALAYQERHPELLIVVVADHETGGLALQLDSTGGLTAAYTTVNHTASMVPLFARGPGAERFAGILPIDEVGRRLIAAITHAPAAAGRGS